MSAVIGSLFSGAGGLDLAVMEVFGGRVAWHVENDPAASKVLAHRFNGVPNHGDIALSTDSRRDHRRGTTAAVRTDVHR